MLMNKNINDIDDEDDDDDDQTNEGDVTSCFLKTNHILN